LHEFGQIREEKDAFHHGAPEVGRDSQKHKFELAQ
jgi:hypothetical protein